MQLPRLIGSVLTASFVRGSQKEGEEYLYQVKPTTPKRGWEGWAVDKVKGIETH